MGASKGGKLLLFRRGLTEDTAVEVTTRLSDESLIAACATGDSAPMGELFERFHVAVYRFLSRMLGCQCADLDDLVQSTFLEVLRAAPRFQRRSAVQTWILGIAANLSRHYMRGEVRRRTLRDEVVYLTDGAIRVEVQRLQPGERFRVLVGASEVEVKGTVFEVVAERGELQGVRVRSGVVAVRRAGMQEFVLATGQSWPQAPPATSVREARSERERKLQRGVHLPHHVHGLLLGHLYRRIDVRPHLSRKVGPGHHAGRTVLVLAPVILIDCLRFNSRDDRS